jgi:hypothetical protein
MKSMVTVRAAGPSGAPMSQTSGSKPGMSLAILARRHLRTEALHAWAIAAGESSLKSQTNPRSSVVFVGCVADHPSLASVAMVAAVNQGLPVFEYEARKIKQAVVGNGAATKSQIQHMVMTLLKLPSRPQEDAADALAIAICHVNTQHNLAKISNSSTAVIGTNRFRRGRFAEETTKK